MGKLNLICGPMYSGKTSELLRRYTRYKLAGKSCLLIKYALDQRYSSDYVVTHEFNKEKAMKCSLLTEVESVISDYDVICIDEIQFFKNANVICDAWSNKGKIVEVCGLNGDYQRKPFDEISLLIPKCENITFLTAIDEKTGEDAVFTKRIIDSNEKELIGGKETYIACSRTTFFE